MLIRLFISTDDITLILWFMKYVGTFSVNFPLHYLIQPNHFVFIYFNYCINNSVQNNYVINYVI